MGRIRERDGSPPTEIVKVMSHYRGSEIGVFIPGGTYDGEWGNFISTHVGGDDVRELPA